MVSLARLRWTGDFVELSPQVSVRWPRSSNGGIGGISVLLTVPRQAESCRLKQVKTSAVVTTQLVYATIVRRLLWLLIRSVLTRPATVAQERTAATAAHIARQQRTQPKFRAIVATRSVPLKFN